MQNKMIIKIRMKGLFVDFFSNFDQDSFKGYDKSVSNDRLYND